jgi:hypothetical protein
METESSHFLSLSLKELQEKNLKAKKLRADRTKIDYQEV